jgi:hypothetical protein
MAKRKKKKPKTKRVKRSIPETASPIRFLIFLTIGLILLGIVVYYGVIRSGG